VIRDIVIGAVFGNHRRMNTPRVLLLCAALSVSACHRGTGAPAPPKPVPHVRVPVVVNKGPTAAQLTAGMVEAASQGKSQLPVQLKFDLAHRPTLGQSLDVNLAVMPQIDASPADIKVTGGDGLTVDPGANAIDLPAVAAGQVYRQSVKVTPSNDGVLLLSVSVSLKHDELTESRAFSIPLIVER
jgi:hypothetical protein